MFRHRCFCAPIDFRTKKSGLRCLVPVNNFRLTQIQYTSTRIHEFYGNECFCVFLTRKLCCYGAVLSGGASPTKVAVVLKLCQDENNSRKLYFLNILYIIIVRTNGFRSVFTHARTYAWMCTSRWILTVAHTLTSGRLPHGLSNTCGNVHRNRHSD